MEALVRAEYPQDEVRVVDGRGGDGGIDIERICGQDRIVYQLKFFPEGFDGRFKDRRRQIVSSLNAVVKDARLDEWVLVFPATPTRSGWAFISELRKLHPDLRVTPWPRDRLDVLCGKHQGVATAIARQGDYFLERVEAYHAERATLTTAGALMERVRGLGALTAEMDPDWALDFSQKGDKTTTTLRARHAAAAEVSPIRITNSLDLSGELAAHAQRLFGYGTGERLVIPSARVRSFRFDGPAWLDTPAPGELTQLEFLPLEDTEDHLDLRFTLYANDHRVSDHLGSVQRVSHGVEGSALTIQFHRGLTLELLLPGVPDHTEAGSRMEISLGGLSPRDAGRSAQMVLDLAAAERVELHVVTVDGNHRLGLAAPSDLGDEDLLQNMREICQAADDLAFIEDQLSTTFKFPTEISTLDRIEVRSLALLLRGRCVPLLKPPVIRMTFDQIPTDDDGQGFLHGEPGAVRFSREDLPWPLLGVDLQLPEVGALHPNVHLDLGEDPHPRVGVVYRIEANDGSPIRLYLPDRVDPSTPLEFSPFNLIGVPEPALGDWPPA